MNLVTQQPIPFSNLVRKSLCKNYKNFCFDWLSSYAHPDEFINWEGITFQDYINCPLMSGNELLYYPELAQRLQAMGNYPILKRCYDIDKNIHGLAFVEYFCQHVKDCHQAFETELSRIALNIHQLIDDYGQKRVVPILNGTHDSTLIIHGVSWRITSNFEVPNVAHYLNLYQLLDIPLWFFNLSIDKIMPETPFMAVRICEIGKNKPYVKWYSLDTRQPVSKREMARWKKSH